MMKTKIFIFIIIMFIIGVIGCVQTSDDIQRHQQEKITMEATNQVGIPNIVNFRERKFLKDILEMRDQTGLITYTYIWNEFNGKPVFFCESVGYGIPYATQYTNPQKYSHQGATLPQADPNGLFSPASAEGTWVLCKNPKGTEVRPTYIEPRIIQTQWRLQ